MPFLAPNQQRQSTEGLYMVMCLQLARVEVDYHRRSLEMLEQLVPQLEEAVGKWRRKKTDHLHPPTHW